MDEGEDGGDANDESKVCDVAMGLREGCELLASVCNCGAEEFAESGTEREECNVLCTPCESL